MKTKERIALHRKLARINRQLQWPGIYTDKILTRELRRERQKVVDKLRDLPLAG